MKQKKEGRFRIFANNAYAVKTVWEISKKRVINIAALSILGYAEWVFTSIFFLRYVIHQIETEAPFASIILGIVICYGVLLLISLYNNYSNAAVIPFTDNLIRKKLYSKLYKKARNVELRCFEDADFYNRYTLAMNGAPERMITSVNVFFGVIFGVIAAAAAFYSMFMIDKFSVLFVISPIIGNFLLGGMMNKIYAGRYVDSVKNNRKMGYVNRVMYLAEYAKEIRLSNIHKLLTKYYDDSVTGNRDVADKYAKKGIIINWIKNVLTFALVFEGIMIYAAYRTMISQTMDLAELAIMFAAMSTSSWILIGMFDNVSEALKNGQFLEYFRSFIEYRETIPEDQDGIIPEKKVHSIEFKNVSFSYDGEANVVNSLSFNVSGDRICAFVGHNGAGKSTLIKLLFRLYDPDEGEILVNDINIKKYNLREYRRLFAAAFQDGKLCSMSVKDNILAGEQGDDTAVETNLKKSLEKSGIAEKIKSLKYGADTILTKEFDDEGAVLSGGETQKLVVARAFAKTASVKVFDEPSSALDPIAEYDLYKNIMSESKNSLTFFISHRLSSVKDADIVYMLENGSIIESGTHTELMNAGGSYAEMYSMQAKNYLADEEVAV
ncbi:MAG: ABC transporter ATP-binding protein/permease [Ruminococcus sp.]|nr:ABC transporter ATP-binding protein/permease [Ruminococcus sp.]